MLDEGQGTGDERGGLIPLAVKTCDSQRLFDAALAARAAHEHDHVNRLCDEVEGRARCGFQGELFKPG